MSTTATLRRSRRAPPKKPENFQVGQVIELTRWNDGTTKVKLTQLLTEGSSTVHPRWLVVFPDNHMEEVYEHRFGKILVRADHEEEPAGTESRRSSASNSPIPPPSAASESKGGNQSLKKNSAPSPSPIHSSSGKNSPSSEMDPDGKKKSVSFPESDGGDSSADKVSAREERSRRRQAMIDEVPASALGTGLSMNGTSIPPPFPTLKRKNGNHSTNISHNNNNNSNNNNTNSISNNNNNNNNNKNGKKRYRHESSPDEPVTKVKLLTGTLYIYRGRSGGRAEFVRRV